MIKFAAFFQHRKNAALKYRLEVFANNVEQAMERSIAMLWYVMAEDHHNFYAVEIKEIEDHEQFD